MLRTTIAEFAKAEIAPLASKIDWESNTPANLASRLPELGLYGICVPADFGGAGADFLSLILAIEEISKASGSLGMQIAVHNAIVCEAFLASSNSDLKHSVLKRLASGTLGAFSFDPKSNITCEIKGNEMIVSGVSEYITNAASAGVFVVLSKMKGGEKVIFGFMKDDVKSDQFRIGPAKKLLGVRAAGTARIEFKEARFPIGSLLFDPQITETALSQLLARSRLAMAAVALGIGQASIDAAVKYSTERKQFNTKIGKFYAIQDFIATDEVSVQTSRALLYDVVSTITKSKTSLRDSAVAKISASNAAVQAARHSIRIHGGYGFIRDYPVERYLRDARAMQLLMETNETLKAQVAEALMSQD
ncbi:MAG: acyl-CoA dehydrogenase family protein [Nitrososphaerota archaeon]|nr:acyl-CoA dehydrogenase family protein [Nitrososphaerota archaeon]